MVGAQIAKLRRRAGLSQAKLAEKLGLSKSTVAMYEQGRREPSVSILVTLAGTLGVTIDYLLTGQPSLPMPLVSEIDKNHAQLIAMILRTAWYIGKDSE